MYVEQIRTLIKNVLAILNQGNIEDPQFRREYLKYEIKKIFIHVSKDIVRNIKLKEFSKKIN